MRVEMWPPWGGVIGDKVTLMFRLFNTHLFTPHLLCRHLKAQFFPWEKVMSPEKGHNGMVWAFQMCYNGCTVVNVILRSHNSSLFVRSSTFSRGFASPPRLFTFLNFFPAHRKATPVEEHGLPYVLTCSFACFCKTAHLHTAKFLFC